MTTALSLPPQEEVTSSAFLKELVRQIRAEDSYGVYRHWSDELVLKPFLVSKEKKRQIPVDGDVEPATLGRLRLFYRAVAALLEAQTGKICQVAIDLSHEGFGWVLIFSGKLLAVVRTVRDVHRFGYDSLAKLATEGEKLVQSGSALLQQYPELTEL